mgnify:CR=1 FL=1
MNTELRIAVIGAGPAGVYSSDIFLRQLKKLGEELGLGTEARIDLFEKLPVPFGLVRYGVAPDHPSIKFIASALEKTLDNPNIHLYCDVEFGKDVTLDDLLARYDAVLFATGAVKDKPLNLPGADLEGVYGAAKFVEWYDGYPTGAREWPLTAENVAVIGGGNVAMDAARCAKRLGAEVHIVYRRSEAELPARAEEVHHAKEEGIEFRMLTNPTSIIGDEKGWVVGISCVEMELGEPDESGRRSPIEKAGSDFEIPCDVVIMALGTSPNPLLKMTTEGLETNRKGCLVADEKGATTREGIFAGGDAVTGAATVILAMGAGRKAAKSIDEYIRQKKH